MRETRKRFPGEPSSFQDVLVAQQEKNPSKKKSVFDCIFRNVRYFPPMPELSITHLVLRANSAEQLTVEIASLAGPFVRIADAWRVLGYCSADAARKAAATQRIGIHVVSLSGRRGRFVRTNDLAEWLFREAVKPIATKEVVECQLIEEEEARTT